MRIRPLALAVLLLIAPPALAEPATPLTALARMPVKEVTVFKDGHAFVQHAGKMPVDDDGNVILDALPQPVLGTFWPYSADKAAKLTAVTASVRKVKLDRTALSIRELIEANVGQTATVTEMPLVPGATDPHPVTYTATIAAVLNQSGEELEGTSPPNGGEQLPVKGSIVLFKTNTGTKAVNIDRVVDLTFANDPRTRVSHEEFRNLLTLKLDWAGKRPAKQADVGMIYVQKGIRWIPNYKVSLDGKGKANVRLQATLINELTDLDDVTANLVIGVPSFAFSSTPDPIALQQTAAQLSTYFARPGQLGNNFDNGSQAFSNSIMTQTRMTEVRAAQNQPGGGGGGGPVDLGPDIASPGKNEDLYLFQVRHVSLKKGQRMTLAVAEYALPYKDVYTLDVPVTPPPDVMRTFDPSRRGEVARLLAAPKVMHQVRLFNKSDQPLTTAPAMVVSGAGDRVIAQGMMHYTAVGAAYDLELTVAVDVQVRKSEEEVKRTPNAEQLNKETFMRIDMSGRLTLVNYAAQPIEVEVTRHILGNVDAVDHDGKKESVNLLEDPTASPTAGDGSKAADWYSSYGWPTWWHRFNGVGRARWTVTLDPGKSVDLGYQWHYYWR